MDCGPTCLRIIAAYYGKNYSLQGLREKCHISRQGYPYWESATQPNRSDSEPPG